MTSRIFLMLSLIAVVSGASAQTPPLHAPKFTDMISLDAGDCENQGQTGTCWCFSGMSFFQAELARMNKAHDLNLSEMFVVRNLYPLKAENYVRMHGKANFGEGGEGGDDVLCLRRFGLMPQSVYDGNKKGIYTSTYVNKLDSILKAAAASDTGILDQHWKEAFNKVLDDSMGQVPQSFDYKGKTYTPQSFASELGLNPDDYIYLTSFTHHPYYQPFVLEVPDNWNWDNYYNVPLADLLRIAEHSLQKGYTLVWGADVTDPKGFKRDNNYAIIPDENGNEKVITPAIRQQAFDNYDTQDDHAMHIVGLAKDENGKTFFKVKNSWEFTPKGKYFYASEAYVALKTTNMMINKKSLPTDIAKKLGIKI